MVESFLKNNKWNIIMVSLTVFITGIVFLMLGGYKKTSDGKKVEYSQNTSLKIGTGLMVSSGLVMFAYLILALAS